jgi:hypothetical protein
MLLSRRRVSCLFPLRASPHKSSEEVGSIPRLTQQEREAALELERLEAEAAYHRDRFALYHARVVTARPSSPARLRELQRASEAATARLAHARSAGKRA